MKHSYCSGIAPHSRFNTHASAKDTNSLFNTQKRLSCKAAGLSAKTNSQNRRLWSPRNMARDGSSFSDFDHSSAHKPAGRLSCFLTPFRLISDITDSEIASTKLNCRRELRFPTLSAVVQLFYLTLGGNSDSRLSVQ